MAAGRWLLPPRPVGTGGSVAAAFASVTRVATEHPAIGDATPWSAVRVARFVPLELAAADRSLIDLDTGDPLLVDATVGIGRTLVLTTPLSLDWTDLAQRAAFVGFALDAARTLQGSGQLDVHYRVGDRLPIDFSVAGSGEVIAPDGSERVAAGALDGRGRVLLDIPGFYEVYTEAGQTTIAVNPDPRESDPTVMSEALQQRWTDALPPRSRAPEAAARRTQIDTSDGLPLAPWLLVALVALLIGEQVLANWFIDRQPDGQRHA